MEYIFLVFFLVIRHKKPGRTYMRLVREMLLFVFFRRQSHKYKKGLFAFGQSAKTELLFFYLWNENFFLNRDVTTFVTFPYITTQLQQ
jgi:hypothetical protein